MQSTVGIRDLKANLSQYIGRVKERGESVVITEHGKPVATLQPFQSDLDLRMKQLQALGIISWNGKKPVFSDDMPENTSDILLSDLVVELRD